MIFPFIFLAALGLHCCMPAFSRCGEPGLLSVVVSGLLMVALTFTRAREGEGRRQFGSTHVHTLTLLQQNEFVLTYSILSLYSLLNNVSSASFHINKYGALS